MKIKHILFIITLTLSIIAHYSGWMYSGDYKVIIGLISFTYTASVIVIRLIHSLVDTGIDEKVIDFFNKKI